MIRALGHLISELLWTCVHKLLDPYATWDHEEDDRTTAENVANWIGEHQHPPDGG